MCENTIGSVIFSTSGGAAICDIAPFKRIFKCPKWSSNICGNTCDTNVPPLEAPNAYTSTCSLCAKSPISVPSFSEKFFNTLYTLDASGFRCQHPLLLDIANTAMFCSYAKLAIETSIGNPLHFGQLFSSFSNQSNASCAHPWKRRNNALGPLDSFGTL